MVKPSVSIRITLRKPSAIPFATPGITITRCASDYVVRDTSMSASAQAGSALREAERQRVFVAVGSNIGDRIGHIKRAMMMLEEGGCRLGKCSRLYESEPMYVEDQDRFINGVIEVSATPLSLAAFSFADHCRCIHHLSRWICCTY
jgi:dihydroneopterin aldolase/2-amino-4-hydroxy-6-hydroxymethyldihydropteridine diphosphokinase/dihydropteroate synthase